MDKIKAIVLAAGEGTRMHSKLPKVLHALCGQPMILYVTEAARAAGAAEVCVVTGHGSDAVMEALRGRGLTFALQAKRLGTGHAVMQAADFIEPDADVLVLYGDTPLVRPETLQAFVAFHRQAGNSVSVISAEVDDPTGYGRIVRDANGGFRAIVEHKDATEAERQIKEINTGIYCFRGDSLRLALSRLTNENVQQEYYLTDTLEILLQDGQPVGAMAAADAAEFSGVNDRSQLAAAEAMLRERINRKHMLAGVTLIAPEQTYIGANVRIGQDTVVYPGSVLEGKTEIGADCIVGPNCRLVDTVLGDGVTFQASTALEASVGDGSTVGPYAYLRPNSRIGKKVKLGDFVEIKNSTIGDGTKVSHLTYIGDADVGERVNFGCGTVVVNYDGVKKYRTVVGDDAFIGCNTNLVSPVRVEQGAYTAAGSTITSDVPADSLGIARSRQENILGWRKKSRE